MLLFYVLFLKSHRKNKFVQRKKPITSDHRLKWLFMNQEDSNPDPRLRRPLLYPTELLIRIAKAGDENRTHVFSLEG